MIKTNNIKHASFYLAQGFTILDVVKKFERRLGDTVYFTFGAETDELERQKEKELVTGTATVNFHLLLNSEITIRDILYRVMRNHTEGKKNEQSRIKRTLVKN